jgi:hypothetical protein
VRVPFSAPVSLVWTSLRSPRVAPPGRALLVARAVLPIELATDAYEVARVVSSIRTAVRDLYPASSDLIEWEHHWISPQPAIDPLAAPVLPQIMPGCEGLFLAGAEIAVPGSAASSVAAATLSGRAVAERILARS